MKTRQAMRLKTIVFVNEEIKKLDDYAYRVRVRAINAHVLSARTGSSAAGYGVLAREIITFSRKLEKACLKLVSLSHEIIIKTSVIVKREKNERLFQKTKSLCHFNAGDAGNVFVINKAEENIRHGLSVLRDERNRLMKIANIDISRMLRLCKDGKMMAVQSKIESMYVSGDRGPFLDAANDFEKSMDFTETLLRGIDGEW